MTTPTTRLRRRRRRWRPWRHTVLCAIGVIATLTSVIVSAVFVVPEDSWTERQYVFTRQHYEDREYIVHHSCVASAHFFEIGTTGDGHNAYAPRPNAFPDSFGPRVPWYVNDTLRTLFDRKAPLYSGLDVRGWPWPAMWCVFDNPHHTPPDIRGGIELRGPPWRFASAALQVPRAISLRVFIVPFIGNVLFYWLALELIVAALCFAFAHRRHRRKRQRCEQCGYTIAHIKSSACPESGAEIRRRQIISS